MSVNENRHSEEGFTAQEQEEYIDQISLVECINQGEHLKNCDKDGYCNNCGHQ